MFGAIKGPYTGISSYRCDKAAVRFLQHNSRQILDDNLENEDEPNNDFHDLKDKECCKDGLGQGRHY